MKSVEPNYHYSDQVEACTANGEKHVIKNRESNKFRSKDKISNRERDSTTSFLRLFDEKCPVCGWQDSRRRPHSEKTHNFLKFHETVHPYIETMHSYDE